MLVVFRGRYWIWMKHEWNFCKDKSRPWKTADDWVAGIDSKSTSVTVNDIERLPTTLSFYLCYMETNKIPLATANDPQLKDRQRLAVSKFGAKSSN